MDKSKTKDVSEVYNKIANWFDSERTKDLNMEQKYLSRLILQRM